MNSLYCKFCEVQSYNMHTGAKLAIIIISSIYSHAQCGKMVIGFNTCTLAITYNRPLSTIIYTLLILMINLNYYNYYSLTATTISQMNYTHGIELQKGCAFTPHHRTQLCCRYTAHTYICQVNALCGVGGWLHDSDGGHFHSCPRQSTWDWIEANPINRAGILGTLR